MADNTQTKRIGPGKYQLTYGQGDPTLSCDIWFNDVANRWQVSETGDGYKAFKDEGYKRKKDLKAAWEQWAESQQGNGDPGASTDDGKSAGSPAAPSTPPRRKGPPKRSDKRKGPPTRKGKGPPRREKKPDPDQSDAVDAAGPAAQAMVSMLDWAYRNRKDLNQMPWRDAMVALHQIDPDAHARYKVETPK